MHIPLFLFLQHSKRKFMRSLDQGHALEDPLSSTPDVKVDIPPAHVIRLESPRFRFTANPPLSSRASMASPQLSTLSRVNSFSNQDGLATHPMSPRGSNTGVRASFFRQQRESRGSM
jgi:hypothetical protein